MTKLLLPMLWVVVLLGNSSATGAGFSLTGSMKTPRIYHTATLLQNGTVLVAGGYNGTNVLASAEIYNPATGLWTNTGSMNAARYFHTATLLPNGKVLVTGSAVGLNNSLSSAELYDPSTGLWTYTGSMTTNRYGHTATLLPDGKVLVAGGKSTVSFPGSTELFDPTTGLWSYSGGITNADTSYGRNFHTATLLPNGRILIAGCTPYYSPNGLYDPSTGQWLASGTIILLDSSFFGVSHTATFLPNSSCLLTGGFVDTLNYVETNAAYLYDSYTGTWTITAHMAASRAYHSATLLPNGQVLVAGGFTSNGSGNNAVPLNSAELYDPTSGTWNATGSLNTPRGQHTATLLPNGQVLIAGGKNNNGLVASAELYDATARVPTPITLGNSSAQSSGAFQFNFAGNPNGTNMVFATTNIALATSNWTSLGVVPEIQPGLYWFADSQSTNYPNRFYQVRSP